MLLASGIGFVRPADVSLVTTHSPASANTLAPPPAQATAAPGAAGSAATAPAGAGPPAPLTALAPALTNPAATPPASMPPAATPPPVTPPAATAALPAELPSSMARRRAQTWELPADPSVLTGYVWPLRGTITDDFGPSPWGELLVNGQTFHDGIDIATWCGDRIVAAHDGIVLAAGRKFDQKLGWVGDLAPYLARLDAKKLWWSLPILVVIDDGNGYRSIYAHFWWIVVKTGQHVHAGQVIGYEGATGLATGCHLHYGLFSPHETATFALQPAIVKRMLLPPAEIARIDPLLVLPARKGITPGSDAASPTIDRSVGSGPHD